MPKRTYRIRNWKQYNKSLVERGSITFWINEKVLEDWQKRPENNKQKGRPRIYGNLLIRTALIIKNIYHLKFRSTEGFLISVAKLNRVNAGVPDYTTICKRQKTVKLTEATIIKAKKAKHIVVDTTGLKFFGEGEWKVRKHGYSKKRGWRKLHLAVDVESQNIEVSRLTDNDTHDCQCIEALIQGIAGKIGQITGDGAYDKYSGYKAAHDRGALGVFPPIVNALTSDENKKQLLKGPPEVWKQRDETILMVRAIGEKGWKELMGYHKRSLAETAMFRFKKQFGGELKARNFGNQVIEAQIKCEALNMMTKLGMPDSYLVTM